MSTRKLRKCRRGSYRENLREGLDGFEADLAILFGAGLADPDHAAADGIQFIIAGDDLDELTTFEPEAAPEAEALGRTVNNKAGNPLGMRSEVDNNTRPFLSNDALRAAAFVHWKCWHGFFLEGFPHYTYYGASATTGNHQVNTCSVRVE